MFGKQENQKSGENKTSSPSQLPATSETSWALSDQLHHIWGSQDWVRALHHCIGQWCLGWPFKILHVAPGSTLAGYVAVITYGAHEDFMSRIVAFASGPRRTHGLDEHDFSLAAW